ncbi:MAG: sulfite oxidase-like oxidoreductase [Sphingobium sp.]|nr:sulfite oxidase-like oxidoreductase [Sphingobium sp.]
MDPDLPPDSKLTQSKRRWASEHRFLTGGEGRAESDRLPPGQHLTDGWPVLDLGSQPVVPLEAWRLNVSGLVETPMTLDWTAFMALPQSQVRSDIHCVTTWSRYDNDWTGVLTRDLLDLVMPRPDAGFVMLHSADGYTTNVPLADFAAPDAMLVHSWQGKPLAREHGGPVRLVIPHLYFWKSAKWIDGIDVLAADEAGFWERNGYHMRGDPWAEERYG